MASKRILIVQEDRLLSLYYRDYLENAGFKVEVFAEHAAALQAISASRPDLVVLDPLSSGSGAMEMIMEIRARPATLKLPVIALPTSRAPVSEAVQQAGATHLLPRSGNTPAELLDAIHQSLGWERTAFVKKMSPLNPDPSWVNMSFEAAPEVLNSLRHSLQAAMKEGADRKHFTQVLTRIHGLAEQMALFSQRPLFQLATAIEALAFDLDRFPERATDSTLRTLGQAIDFLAMLLPEAVRAKLKDPAAAQVLVVDDEEGARMIVMAAMELVGLNAAAADTPSAGLAALNTQPFDLIFLDVGLPEMNGFELCARLRAISLHEKTPVVFITGMATFQNRVQSSLSGGNDFVGKPFSVPELGLKGLIWVFKAQLGML
ncbi:MAG TPA: response regulator [Chthoniobacteraceae bacterium]|jgi:DNA-binding response OmpR family regulator